MADLATGESACKFDEKMEGVRILHKVCEGKEVRECARKER